MADLPSFEITATLVADPTITVGTVTLPSFEITATLVADPTITVGTVTLPAFEVTGTIYYPVDFIGTITLPSLATTGTILRELLADSWAIRPKNEIYICTISAGGFDDVILPISSWQARFRTDEAESYVAISVPGMEYWEEIADREAGTITIAKGYNFLDTDETFSTDIIVADIDSISNDQGPRSSAIKITAYTTLVEIPKTVAVDQIFYKAVAPNGDVRWRMPLYLDIDSEAGDFFIKPGDTVTNDGDSIEVGYISISVSTMQENMEITSV